MKVCNLNDPALPGDSLSLTWKVPVESSKFYEVRITEPVFHDRALLNAGTVPGRRFVIIDSGVPVTYRDCLSTYFQLHDVEAHILIVNGGEACKKIEAVLDIIAELERFELDRRNEPVIVVGGGAVLDVGSFAASIYRRGVPFIRVPTTLLAYVDASIGIKTGVNYGIAKNLIGTFTAPELVLLDRGFLRSLPGREVSNGLGEILKLAVACDVELFTSLEEQAHLILSNGFDNESNFRILQRAIHVMLCELSQNIFEKNLCRAVDLGHTFSQVFEMYPGSNALRHGEAVAIDVNLSAIISARRGLLSELDLCRVAKLTDELGLPRIVPNVEPSALWRSLLERVRHRGGRQRVPLPSRLGACVFIDDLTSNEVLNAFTEFKAWGLAGHAYAAQRTSEHSLAPCRIC
jgi:3-dehydroquinate synthase